MINVDLSAHRTPKIVVESSKNQKSPASIIFCANENKFTNGDRLKTELEVSNEMSYILNIFRKFTISTLTLEQDIIKSRRDSHVAYFRQQ
jgi:hypothetical protein